MLLQLPGALLKNRSKYRVPKMTLSAIFTRTYCYR